jgi:hypothetical protein
MFLLLKQIVFILLQILLPVWSPKLRNFIVSLPFHYRFIPLQSVNKFVKQFSVLLITVSKLFNLLISYILSLINTLSFQLVLLPLLALFVLLSLVVYTFLWDLSTISAQSCWTAAHLIFVTVLSTHLLVTLVSPILPPLFLCSQAQIPSR